MHRRAVVAERPMYPAFAPDNFNTVQAASKTALRLAKQASMENPASRTARRDLAFAEAAVARWPDGSALGKARDSAEKTYSAAMQQFGRL